MHDRLMESDEDWVVHRIEPLGLYDEYDETMGLEYGARWGSSMYSVMSIDNEPDHGVNSRSVKQEKRKRRRKQIDTARKRNCVNKINDIEKKKEVNKNKTSDVNDNIKKVWAWADTNIIHNL